VRELQGRTITKGYSARKNAAPVFSGQLSRKGRQFDLDYDPLEGTFQVIFTASEQHVL